MIRIDDTLLQELGLNSLPKEERDALLRQIYETLEMRVGMRLAERMSDQQLDEFEKFIDGDVVFTEQYLSSVKPNWQQSPEYQTALKNAQEAATRAGRNFNEAAVKSEFGALAWLETNFPDYKQVVASELDKLKAEIKQDSAQILEALQNPQNPNPNLTSQQSLPPQPDTPFSSDQNQQPPMAA